MNGLFELIDEGFNPTWDPETLSENWQVISQQEYGIFSSPDRVPHWQYFKRAQIYFSRNFHFNYLKESKQIVDHLIAVQQRCKPRSPQTKLLSKFLNHRIIPENITLIKVDPGSEVQLHTDRSRQASINIGLKNSHAGITRIWDGAVVPETFINKHNTMYTYQMQDGQTYIVNVDQPHSVVPAPGASGARYIISYTIC